MASLPGWIWAARRYGKKAAGVTGVCGLGASTAVVYPLFPVGDLGAPLIYSLVGGVLAGAIVLLDALVADTIDYDRLKTGLDREGLYFGVWRMGTKLARALGLGLNGVVLWAIGFAEGTTVQAPETGWRLALLFGPLVGI
ncbi:MAG TPA: MFS transporter, partial [Anaerolineae bacterium]|nr:MFS transporter [Anaerolineae bacterium]